MADADSLPGILADLGVRMKSLAPGYNQHMICPRCSGGKSREMSLSVTIDPDGAGVAWVCHRGTCGWTGGQRVHGEAERAPVVRKEVRKPQPHTPDQTGNQPDWLFQFFAERNIGARTVRKFGIYATTRRFPDPIGEAQAIVFPYVWKGEVVNRKYRPHPAKNPQAQEKDALQTLYNADVLDGADVVHIVEGEPDVIALGELGISAVSLKDGAPSKVNDQSEKRFEALATHAEALSQIRKFVLAGDMDGPGLALREELARRLGRHRCWLVTWPDGCKDACDTLRTLGAEAVSRALADAEAYPIDGMQRVKAGTLAALRRLPPPPVLTTGTVASDAVLKLPGEGRLIVLTGYPANGKTSWLRFVMVHTAGEHDRRWLVFSPESQPWEQFAAQCAEVWVGAPFYREGQGGWSPMSDNELAAAEEWLSTRVTLLVCDAEDQAPTLDWLIDRARLAVLQHGVTDFVIDPWNEVAHERGKDTETDYIGRSLQRLKAFGLRHGCNIWIAAHPAKPPPLKPGEVRSAPGPYEISSSAHWANKADLGLTVHGASPANVGLHIWKARFRRFGKHPAVALLEYEPVTGRYTSHGGQHTSGIGTVTERAL